MGPTLKVQASPRSVITEGRADTGKVVGWETQGRTVDGRDGKATEAEANEQR